MSKKVRSYNQVTNTARSNLLRLIHVQGLSITNAARLIGIPYDNAKAINRTFIKQGRINKIQ